MVMPHLLRHVGERMARWLLLCGELIDAQSPRQAGLINAGDARRRAPGDGYGLGAALAEGGPEALAKTKAFLRQFSRQSVSIEEAAQGSAAPRLSDECQAGPARVLRQAAAAMGVSEGAAGAG